MGTVHYKLTADESKAVDAFRKLVDKQNQSAQKFREMSTESGKMDTAAQKVVGSVGQIASAFGMGLGVAGMIALAKGELEKFDQYMLSVAAHAREINQNMVAFSMMQAPGQIGQRVQQTAAVGAEYGVQPGEALFTTQAFQAKLGSFDKGLEAARAAFELKQLAAVPMAGAKSAVSVGLGLGLSPSEAARAAYSAGEASALSPAELAQMAGRGLPAYKSVGGGPITGYGVAAALSGLIEDPGQLATYTKQIGTLAQLRSGKAGELWKSVGITEPGANLPAQLQALSDAGITSMGDLVDAGIAKKESLGLSILMADLPGSLKTMERVKALYGDENIIGRKRGAAEAEIPMIRQVREIEESEARQAVLETTGRIGQRASTRALWETHMAEQFKEAHPDLAYVIGDDKRMGRTERFKAQVLSGWMGLGEEWIGTAAMGPEGYARELEADRMMDTLRRHDRGPSGGQRTDPLTGRSLGAAEVPTPVSPSGVPAMAALEQAVRENTAAQSSESGLVDRLVQAIETGKTLPTESMAADLPQPGE